MKDLDELYIEIRNQLQAGEGGGRSLQGKVLMMNIDEKH